MKRASLDVGEIESLRALPPAPYRALAVVEPYAERTPLPAFRPIDSWRDAVCLKCGVNSARLTRGTCTGGRRGFLWFQRCTEKREHFHTVCQCCGHRALMATADAKVGT